MPTAASSPDRSDPQPEGLSDCGGYATCIFDKAERPHFDGRFFSFTPIDPITRVRLP